MPNSLKCRLKNLVRNGLLREKDLERIIIIPECKNLVSGSIDASKMQLKPIAFYTGEPMNTNLRMLKDLDAEQLYDKMVWLFQDYGRRFADSRAGIIEWLNSEVKA